MVFQWRVGKTRKKTAEDDLMNNEKIARLNSRGMPAERAESTAVHKSRHYSCVDDLPGMPVKILDIRNLSDADRMNIVAFRMKQGLGCLFIDEPRYLKIASRWRKQLREAAAGKANALPVVAFGTADYTLVQQIADMGDDTAVTENKVEVGEGEWDKRLNDILRDAAKMEASDVHIQVSADSTVVKYRVHGELIQTRGRLPAHYGEMLRNKIFYRADAASKSAEMDRNKPEDLRLHMNVDMGPEKKCRHTSLACRVVMLPVDAGFDITMRLIYQTGGATKSLSQLGFSLEQAEAIKEMVESPHGMIILSGPTGSGKSTTLQSLAHYYISKHKGTKLLRTMEDPVEYEILNSRQSSVVRKKGSGEIDDEAFSAQLKGMMRGDPDAILVGEIRDRMTGEIGQQAAQTGHLVFTTVHANSALATVERLLSDGIGMDRHVLASPGMLRMVIYQLLAKRICPDCSVPYQEYKFQLQRHFHDRLKQVIPDIAQIDTIRFRGGGCKKCGGQGIIGRTVVPEIFIPDRRMREYVMDKKPLELQAYWRAGGDGRYPGVTGFTMLDSAVRLIREGVCCPLDIDHSICRIALEESPADAKKWLIHRDEAYAASLNQVG